MSATSFVLDAPFVWPPPPEPAPKVRAPALPPRPGSPLGDLWLDGAMTPETAASYLGVNTSRVRDLVDSRVLTCGTIPGAASQLIPKRSLVRYLYAAARADPRDVDYPTNAVLAHVYGLARDLAGHYSTVRFFLTPQLEGGETVCVVGGQEHRIPPTAPVGEVEWFRRRAKRVGRWYDAVSRWWVADRPPDFCLTATSALQGLLIAAARLLACFRATSDDSPETAAAVTGWCTGELDPAVIGAALRCEVASLGRTHPQPLTCRWDLVTYKSIRLAARDWFNYECPKPGDNGRPWRALSPDEKRHVAETMLAAAPRPSHRPRQPRRVYDDKLCELKASHCAWKDIAAKLKAEWGDAVPGIGALKKRLRELRAMGK